VPRCFCLFVPSRSHGFNCPQTYLLLIMPRDDMSDVEENQDKTRKSTKSSDFRKESSGPDTDAREDDEDKSGSEEEYEIREILNAQKGRFEGVRVTDSPIITRLFMRNLSAPCRAKWDTLSVGKVTQMSTIAGSLNVMLGASQTCVELIEGTNFSFFFFFQKRAGSD